jgi:hypothetical protein
MAELILRTLHFYEDFPLPIPFPTVFVNAVVVEELLVQSQSQSQSQTLICSFSEKLYYNYSSPAKRNQGGLDLNLCEPIDTSIMACSREQVIAKAIPKL